LRRVASDTLAPSVKVRETAERDTPATRATSWALTNDLFLASPIPTILARRALEHLCILIAQPCGGKQDFQYVRDERHCMWP